MGDKTNKTRMMMKIMVVVVMMMVYELSHESIRVEAQVHHVVGEDPGWDAASDIASWASARTFAVGDFLWFAYSGGLNKENVVELRTKQEFESCDVSNPIKMYTDGLDKIALQEEGMRYFASSNPDKCRKGLKLPVEVKSKTTTILIKSIPSSEKDALAEEPTSPSSSNKICESMVMIIAGIVFSYITAIAIV